jgi:hypothetical protein
MKCRGCDCSVKGYFKHLPEEYVCTGVKEPFVIEDYKNAECTVYKDPPKKEKIKRIYEDDDFIIDLFPDEPMVRVSIFKDCHFQDEVFVRKDEYTQ